jgi:hypothetical protein
LENADPAHNFAGFRTSRQSLGERSWAVHRRWLGRQSSRLHPSTTLNFINHFIVATPAANQQQNLSFRLKRHPNSAPLARLVNV